ncbi:hypothetical protein NON20_22610 [Synechocystis sp. B12]|nr:hypothetical protein NON20_22610 [Synechocystis sp. B12]
MANSVFDLPIATPARAKPFGLPAWLVLVCVVTFSVLLRAEAAIYKNAPHSCHGDFPQQEIIMTQAEVERGQATYLARGGQHIGSIWGHGSYLAPDWTADVLHRWGLATAGVLYDGDADFSQTDLEALPPVAQPNSRQK